MILKRSVRIVKKIQIDRVWKFVSLERQGTRYVWDDRPGGYFLDWHEGGRITRSSYPFGEKPILPLPVT